MCYYIKDDGEQCGMDEGPYCRHHDDTIQARLYERTAEKYGETLEPKVLGLFWRGVEDAIEAKEDDIIQRLEQAASQGAESGSSGIEMDTTCGDCEAPLRRTERLTEHPRFGGKVLFEAVVECDCDEHVLGAQSVRLGEIPEGWQ